MCVCVVRGFLSEEKRVVSRVMCAKNKKMGQMNHAKLGGRCCVVLRNEISAGVRYAGARLVD